jgi:hypothetical protein
MSRSYTSSPPSVCSGTAFALYKHFTWLNICLPSDCSTLFIYAAGTHLPCEWRNDCLCFPDKQRHTSSLQRNLMYPVAMLLLCALTAVTVLMVLQNTLELLIGIKALPLSTRVSSLLLTCSSHTYCFHLLHQQLRTRMEFMCLLRYHIQLMITDVICIPFCVSIKYVQSNNINRFWTMEFL